jgi:hypothetical protein
LAHAAPVKAARIKNPRVSYRASLTDRHGLFQRDNQSDISKDNAMTESSKTKIFRIRGTAAEPYTVNVTRIGDALRIKCDCPAGVYMDPCEHWKSLFTGEEQDYIDLDENDILEVQGWLDESDLDEALQNLLYFEGHEKNMHENLARQKRALRGRVIDILISEPQL